MTTKQILELQQTVTLLLLEDDENKKIALVERLQLKAGQVLEETKTTKCKDLGRFLTLTKKEVEKLPKRFQKKINVGAFRVSCERRKRGNCISYIIRFNRGGYKIYVCSTTLEGVIQKFTQEVTEQTATIEQKEKEQSPTNFSTLVNYYIDNYKARKVTKSTLERDKGRIKANILPYFKDYTLKNITAIVCQKFFDDLTVAGKYKTAKECYSILNGFFKYAIFNDLMTKNPLQVVIIEKREATHGQALTLEEEKILLEKTPQNFRHLIAVALYCGLRPNEYTTAKIDGNFIVANNSKRKGGKVESKRIPITPMLAPYLAGANNIVFPPCLVITKLVKDILPNHKLYDLRTTFFNRCTECGVAPSARDEFLGHKTDKITTAYTDLSDDFLLKEGQKINYKLP